MTGSQWNSKRNSASMDRFFYTKFGKDGSVTKFCEGIPVVGHIAAAGHKLAGDQDKAERALDNCNATLTSTFGKDGSVTRFCEGVPLIGYIASAGHRLAGDKDKAARAMDSCNNTIVEAFDRDGKGTRLMENIPIIGYIASAGHAIAGSTDRANRACAKCNKAMLTTGAVVGASLLAGPAGTAAVIGATAAGGAVGGAAGALAEAKHAEVVNDPKVRKNMNSFTTKDILSDTVFGAIGGAAGTIGGEVAGDFVARNVLPVTSVVRRQAIKMTGDAVVSGVATVPQAYIGKTGDKEDDEEKCQCPYMVAWNGETGDAQLIRCDCVTSDDKDSRPMEAEESSQHVNDDVEIGPLIDLSPENSDSNKEYEMKWVRDEEEIYFRTKDCDVTL